MLRELSEAKNKTRRTTDYIEPVSELILKRWDYLKEEQPLPVSHHTL
jgi:hypothetical protein